MACKNCHELKLKGLCPAWCQGSLLELRRGMELMNGGGAGGANDGRVVHVVRGADLRMSVGDSCVGRVSDFELRTKEERCSR